MQLLEFEHILNRKASERVSDQSARNAPLAKMQKQQIRSMASCLLKRLRKPLGTHCVLTQWQWGHAKQTEAEKRN